ncbi:MAG TPA: metallophosphoesterase family protein [Burkholderiaceae bacterium]|nr:metallophosphoesterase family protein [Burkholderiaceae bacterium]
MSEVGLISDTHGLLRPQALKALEGCDYIIHAGDIGDPEILETLAGMAPVTVVRGNNDVQPWASTIESHAWLTVDAARIHVVHDIADLTSDVHAGTTHAVVFGHSHRPLCETRDGVLFVNPGSAGPRRFKLPISVGRLWVDGSRITARVIELDDVRLAKPISRAASATQVQRS